MGYRSDVRSLIYGDPDLVDALIAKHALLGRKGSTILDDVRVYDIRRQGMVAITNPAEMQPGVIECEVTTYRCIDLQGEDWKWYDGYEEVDLWHALLAEAEELELNTEFVRIGEEDLDIVVERNIPDDGDYLISVSRSIQSDIDEIVNEDNKDG